MLPKMGHLTNVPFATQKSSFSLMNTKRFIVLTSRRYECTNTLMHLPRNYLGHDLDTC